VDNSSAAGNGSVQQWYTWTVTFPVLADLPLLLATPNAPVDPSFPSLAPLSAVSTSAALQAAQGGGSGASPTGLGGSQRVCENAVVGAHYVLSTDGAGAVAAAEVHLTVADYNTLTVLHCCNRCTSPWPTSCCPRRARRPPPPSATAPCWWSR
jgi:hypothetical protein